MLEKGEIEPPPLTKRRFKMQTQNYLTAGLITILLISVLFISGCGCGCGSEQVPTGTSKGEGEGLPPTSDVSGKDISDIARYTGSVRIFYGENVRGTTPGTIVVGYLTSESIDTVLDFYQTQLPADGWTVIDMGEVSKMPAAMKEGRGSAIVTITASEDYSGYTDINIVLIPE